MARSTPLDATSGTGDLAIAYGADSSATAEGGTGDYALADGTDALAKAGTRQKSITRLNVRFAGKRVCRLWQKHFAPNPSPRRPAHERPRPCRRTRADPGDHHSQRAAAAQRQPPPQGIGIHVDTAHQDLERATVER